MNKSHYPQLLKLLKSAGDIDFDHPSVIKTLDIASELINKIENDKLKSVEQSTKLKMILDLTPCTISWVKNDMTYGGVNETLANVCGIAADEFIGKKIGFFTKNAYFYNFAEQLFLTNKNQLYQEIETHIAGDLRKYWVVGTKSTDQNQAVIIGVDVTQLRNLEQNVTFMDKLSSLGEMVASIIHEVNNPLMLINTSTTKINRLVEANDIDKIPAMTLKIKKTTEKISKIIKGIKCFVRHGDKDPMVDSSIKEIIEDSVLICEGKLKESSVTFEIEGEDVILPCNITQILQVFVNLITNSIDAMVEKKLENRKIIIKLQVISEQLNVLFIDSGKGIPEEISAKMFDSFFTTKSIGKGTGLGLSLCKKIMIEHGGDLTIDNSAPQTTFQILFKTSD